MRIIDCLDRGSAMFPDVDLFRSDELRYSHADVQALSHRFALALAAAGESENTPIAIFSPNDVRGLVCLFGIHRLGGVYVRLNWKSPLSESLHILQVTGARWLFFHSDALEHVPEILNKVPSLCQLVCIDATVQGYPSLEAFLDPHSGRVPPLPNDRDHVMMFASTGGTTGLPKLVELTDLNFETAIAAQLSSMPCSGRPVFLIASAMTHAAISVAYGLISQGATVIVLKQADPLRILQAIETNRVTHLYLPPTVIYDLLQQPEIGDFDYSSLQYFIYGAAPIAPARLKEAIARFGPVFCQFYGQAECPMFITVLTPMDHPSGTDPDAEQRLLSCGRPTVFCRVAIMDEAGSLLPDGELGEIVTRGNLVMRGYHDNPAATAEVSTFGWHHTGDIGYFGDDGFLYLTDRKREIIISGGFNVYPSEVEKALSEHPAVLECAVIGIPHERWGEAVHGIVRLRTGRDATTEELVRFCRDRLGGVKAPKNIEIVPEIPKSAAGKVLRKEIRARYWEGRERAI